MYVCNKNATCFINLHEFVYTPGVFEALMFLPSDEIPHEEVNKLFEETAEENDANVEPKHMGGQPSLVSKFPEIVDTTAEFINDE